MSIFKLFIWAVVFYPGTVLHEMAHAVTSKLLGGSVEGFSLTPTIKEDRIVLGSVVVSHRFAGINIFSCLSPLVWWILAVLLLREMELLNFNIKNEHLVVVFNLAYKDWSWDSIVSAYGIAQLFWAGSLSKTDIISAARSLLSPSGVIVLIVLMTVVYVFA